MNIRCDACEFDFERDAGFYLGAIYFNYGLTAMIVTIAYVAMSLFTDASKELKLSVAAAPALLFPLMFFRYARSLWLGFDFFIDRETRER